jgi:prepilin-type N-terminal cleavage/methylation domain-containing protein
MRPRDGGFTLIELIVAMMVMLIVMSAVLFFFVGSLRAVTLAKQRQTATALATQVMEQIRALPYAMVEQGLDSTDITLTGPDADPNLSSVTQFRPVTGGIVEELVVTTPATPSPRGPLSPHVQNLTPEPGGPTYVVRSYVTKGDTPEQSYNLSVLASWSSSVSNGTKTVIQRSVSYSPSGCLSTATHPFSGPCQALFTAQAGTSAAGIQVSAIDQGQLVGLGSEPVILAFPGMSSSLGIEQITKLTSSVFASSGKVNGALAGGVSATAAADTDPSSTNAFVGSATTPAQSPSSLSTAGTLGTVKVRVHSHAADSGKVGALTSAAGSTCVAHDGTAITNKLPCASASIATSGSVASIELELDAGKTLTLGSSEGVSGGAAASRQVAASGNCSGLGCSVASVRRSIGPIEAGALPGGGTGVPAGYVNQFTVGAFEESLVVGTGQNQPALPTSITRSAGNVKFWNGTGYSTLDVATGGSAKTAKVTAVYGTATVAIETELSVTGKSLTIPPPPASCKSSACSAVGTPASVVTAKTTYTVTVGGQSTTFVVSTDLGAVSVRSAWQEAPDA